MEDPDLIAWGRMVWDNDLVYIYHISTNTNEQVSDWDIINEMDLQYRSEVLGIRPIYY